VSKKGEGHEADAYPCDHRRARGLRDDAAAAGDADLRQRDVDPGDGAVPAATAAAASATSADDHLPRRHAGRGRDHLSDAAASAAAAAPRRRTRVSVPIP